MQEYQEIGLDVVNKTVKTVKDAASNETCKAEARTEAAMRAGASYGLSPFDIGTQRLLRLTRSNRPFGTRSKRMQSSSATSSRAAPPGDCNYASGCAGVQHIG